MRSHVLLAVAGLAAILPVHAQDGRRSGSATNVYQVEYHFRDGSDPANTVDRRYSMLVNGGNKAVFKVGNRTPAVTGTLEPVNAGALVNTQYSYLDLGVNIECTLLELDTKVELHTSLDLSTVDEKATPPPAAAGVHNPVIKQTRLEANATVSLGRPTVLATIVDPATKHSLQVEATVTPAN